MNRALVEAATHPEALDRIAEAHGWQSYRQKINGKLLAEARTADLAILDRTEPLGAFPDDEQLRTRLGEDGVVLRLAPGTVGVFGLPITRIALPAFWSQGLTGEEAVEVEAGAPIRMTVGDKDLFYDFGGLRRF